MSFRHDQTPTSSSGTSTPSNTGGLSSSWTVPATVSQTIGGLLRRFSSDPPKNQGHNSHNGKYSSTFPASSEHSGVYTPPYRTASPFQPPPLYPISLIGYKESTSESARLLSRGLAEEIRLLVPPRLQLCEEWRLVYNLEEDGVSLGTLYTKCDALRGLRNGFVLVVKDSDGGLFGAYLTEAPHPSPHYFGTGECFLWRATLLSPLSPTFTQTLPPTSDTTYTQHTTTISSSNPPPLPGSPHNHTLAPHSSIPTGAATPISPPTPTNTQSIRFKAFPYSGINDYLIFCETGFLSIGGGDGHYGLWLDDNFERGVSSTCPTFGNEPLSEGGEKFDIVGVEVWSIGN
ncbi:TLD-domain-containing protein [Tricladium varicosporioides]|nr:TLD-domain-containing protein [Hymenoscyphus varicosporioides]